MNIVKAVNHKSCHYFGILSRSARTADAIPAYVEALFRFTALRFKFD